MASDNVRIKREVEDPSYGKTDHFVISFGFKRDLVFQDFHLPKFNVVRGTRRAKLRAS